MGQDSVVLDVNLECFSNPEAISGNLPGQHKKVNHDNLSRKLRPITNPYADYSNSNSVPYPTSSIYNNCESSSNQSHSQLFENQNSHNQPPFWCCYELKKFRDKLLGYYQKKINDFKDQQSLMSDKVLSEMIVHTWMWTPSGLLAFRLVATLVILSFIIFDFFANSKNRGIFWGFYGENLGLLLVTFYFTLASIHSRSQIKFQFDKHKEDIKAACQNQPALARSDYVARLKKDINYDSPTHSQFVINEKDQTNFLLTQLNDESKDYYLFLDRMKQILIHEGERARSKSHEKDLFFNARIASLKLCRASDSSKSSAYFFRIFNFGFWYVRPGQIVNDSNLFHSCLVFFSNIVLPIHLLVILAFLANKISLGIPITYFESLRYFFVLLLLVLDHVSVYFSIKLKKSLAYVESLMLSYESLILTLWFLKIDNSILADGVLYNFLDFSQNEKVPRIVILLISTPLLVVPFIILILATFFSRNILNYKASFIDQQPTYEDFPQSTQCSNDQKIQPKFNDYNKSLANKRESNLYSNQTGQNLKFPNVSKYYIAANPTYESFDTKTKNFNTNKIQLHFPNASAPDCFNG